MIELIVGIASAIFDILCTIFEIFWGLAWSFFELALELCGFCIMIPLNMIDRIKRGPPC